MAPLVVDVLKDGTFYWHLIQDILRGEDWLEIQPCGLHFQPGIKVLLSSQEIVFPAGDLIDEDLREGGPLHSLRLDDVVIEQSRDQFDRLTLENEGATVFLAQELHWGPVIRHLLQGSLVAEFLGGGF